MKSPVIKLTILCLCITFSNCYESCSYIESADEFDLDKIVGEWYTIMRWKNSIDYEITCTESTVGKDRKIVRTNYLPGGNKEVISAYFDTAATCKANVFAKWPPNQPSKLVVVYIDYETFGITQACFKDNEYLWIYTREKYPCKDVLKKIDEIIRTNRLDRHEIIRHVITYATFSKCDADCSFIDTGNAMDIKLTPGDWFGIMRWENGAESSTTCSKVTVGDDLTIKRSDFYKEGKKIDLTGSINSEKSIGCSGKVILTMPKEFPNKVYVIYFDHENVAVSQACFNDTDYMWVHTREKHPCKEVLKKIDEVIKSNNLDRHEIFRQCLD